MGKVKIRFLADSEELGASKDEELVVSQEVADELIASGVAEEADLTSDVEDELQKKAAEAVTAMADKFATAVVEKIASIPGERKLPVVTVGDDLKTKDPDYAMKLMGEAMREAAITGRRGTPLEAFKTAGHMAEYDDSQGGYLVPQPIADFFYTKDIEDDIVQGMSSVLPMTSATLGINALVDSTHVDSVVHGGITLYWVGEADEKALSKPTFERVTLRVHTLAGLVHASDELLQDSPLALGAMLKQWFGEAFGHKKMNEWMNGDGVAKPLGAFHAANASRIAVAREAAGAIQALDIVNMAARCYDFANATWFANADTLPYLTQLVWPGGAAGNAALWLPNLREGWPSMLLGRPLFLTEHCQTLGTTGDICLGSMKHYAIGIRQQLDAASSIHVRFVWDETTFRFTMRLDGRPLWLGKLTPKHGANTVSPFVVLDSNVTTTTTTGQL